MRRHEGGDPEGGQNLVSRVVGVQLQGHRVQHTQRHLQVHDTIVQGLQQTRPLGDQLRMRPQHIHAFLEGAEVALLRAEDSEQRHVQLSRHSQIIALRPRRRTVRCQRAEESQSLLVINVVKPAEAPPQFGLAFRRFGHMPGRPPQLRPVVIPGVDILHVEVRLRQILQERHIAQLPQLLDTPGPGRR